MHSEVPTHDVMRRTLWNLNFINEYRRQEGRLCHEGPFEVTQLVNSFLGALAHPWERLEDVLDAKQLSEIEELHWPEVVAEEEGDKVLSTVGDLVRLVRNAFAHGNIEFLPNADYDIGSVRFWNENMNGERTWGSTLDVDTLSRFLACFVRLAEENRSELSLPRKGQARPAAALSERARDRTDRASTAEVVRVLRNTVGQKLVAVIAGIDDPRTAGEWARGRQKPGDEEERRLREAFQVATLLTLANSQQAARRWLMEMNPVLNDRAPAFVFAEEAEGGARVMEAARAFLAHG